MDDLAGGVMVIKMRRGDVVRLGGGISIEMRAEGEDSARISVSAPRSVPITIERGIKSPFYDMKRAN